MTENNYKNTDIGKIPLDWNAMPLKSIGSFSKGRGISRASSNSGKIPAIRYGEIYTTHDDYIKSFSSHISEEVAKSSKIIHQGDILFTSSGETKEDIGKSVAYTLKDEAYAGGDIIILSPKKGFDPLYLGYVTNSSATKKQKSEKGRGDAIVHIITKDLGNVIVPVPPFREQERIANALKSIDNLLISFDKLIEKKQNIKKAAMQELLTGKVRLKGFKKEWKTIALGDVGEPKMCKRIMKWQTNSINGIPFYKIGTFGKKADAFISEETFNNYRKKYNYPKKGDILISAAGTIGRTVVFDGRPSYYQDSNIVWVENDEKIILNQFLAYYYRIIKWQTEDGGIVSRLYNDNIKKAKLTIPSDLAEQQAIAMALTAIDKEIGALKQQRIKYAEIREGMKQQLLTGKCRLK